MIVFPNVIHILAQINSHDKIGYKINKKYNIIIYICAIFFTYLGYITLFECI